MKNFIEILKKCPLFYDIEEENIEKVLACLNAKVETFDKKYTIMGEGNSSKYVGILLSGSAQIIQNDYFGNRSILGNIREGEVFAEAFACAGVQFLPVSVIANELSTVMFIECDRILHTCEKGCSFHQQLIFNLMKDLAVKAIMFHQKMEILSKRTTREKLMTFLLLVAKREKSNSFSIPFDRQELADYLEVDRSGLSAEISKLRNEGVIESHKKHFVLL